MAKIDLISEKRMNRTISRLPGVRAEVAEKGLGFGVKAEAILLSHRDVTNATDHRISVEQGRVDTSIILEGPAPGAVEFGHRHNNSDQWVQGLYILHRAVGLM